MKILSRYVFREFLAPLFYCLAGFVSIYVLFELFGSFSRIVEAKLPASSAALYLAGYLSPFFHYLAPAALMLATLYTVWNLSRHSEITAMRASGVGLGAVVRPLLLASLAMAALVAWVDEGFMPRRAQWAKRLRAERFDAEKAGRDGGFSYCNTRDRRTWTVNGAADPTYSRLSDVRISTDRADGTRECAVTAASAEYLDGEWWLSGVETRHYGTDGRPCASPSPELDALPLRSFPQFRERPGDMLMQNSDARFGSVRDKLRYMRTNRDLSPESREELRYDAWSQALAPFACVVVTLLSIPACLATGRQAAFAGILGAVGMFFAYYGMVIGCMVLAKTGAMPAVPAALAPPLSFLALAAFHLARPLRPTLVLMAVFFAMLAAYAVSASYLSAALPGDRALAHSLAATLPALAAAASAVALVRRTHPR